MTKLQAPLDVEEIKKRLPHRHPFLLVDKVLSLEAKDPGQVVGRVLKAVKNVTSGDFFFPGHFPHKAVMPGVLILEAIAQAGALCCGALPSDPPMKEIFFVGAEHVRFKKPVVPGDVLKLQVEMKRQKNHFYWGRGEAYVDSELAARADIIAHIVFSRLV